MDPVGMSGVRLEGNFHIITAQSTAINNINKCVTKAGLEIDNLILEPLSSSMSVLSDEEKKDKYYRYGEEGLTNAGGENSHDPFDIFSQFFGGGRTRRQQEPSRGPDVVMPLRVSLSDLYNGKSLQFSIRREVGAI